MKHGTVADMAVHLDDGIGSGKPVHDTGVLEIASLLQDEPAKIAPQRRTGPHIGTGPDNHIADQHRAGMHVGAGMNDRNDAVYRVDHGILCKLLSALVGWDKRSASQHRRLNHVRNVGMRVAYPDLRPSSAGTSSLSAFSAVSISEHHFRSNSSLLRLRRAYLR